MDGLLSRKVLLVIFIAASLSNTNPSVRL